MNQTWARFRNDKYYLTKYFLAHWMVLSLVAVGFYQLRGGLDLDFAFSFAHLLLLPLCVFPGIMIPVLMHNCTHGNLKTRFLNDIIGEFTAFFCLMSIGIVRINHTLHHAFSDTEHDPHPPGAKSFLEYLFVSQFIGADIIEARYLSYHGDSRSHRLIFKLNRGLHYGSYGLRTLCWLLILGPELFFTFFVPSFLIFSFGFAHVNYVTHSTDEDGKVQITNKDDNLYYKFINFIGSGIYYHKNHHKNPKLPDPRQLGIEASPQSSPDMRSEVA